MGAMIRAAKRLFEYPLGFKFDDKYLPDIMAGRKKSTTRAIDCPIQYDPRCRLTTGQCIDILSPRHKRVAIAKLTRLPELVRELSDDGFEKAVRHRPKSRVLEIQTGIREAKACYTAHGKRHLIPPIVSAEKLENHIDYVVWVRFSFAIVDLNPPPCNIRLPRAVKFGCGARILAKPNPKRKTR